MHHVGFSILICSAGLSPCIPLNTVSQNTPISTLFYSLKVRGQVSHTHKTKKKQNKNVCCFIRHVFRQNVKRDESGVNNTK
jgi:hypothetical protein